MDGGGRLLGSLSAALSGVFGLARPRLAGWPAEFEAVAPVPAPRPLNRRERRARRRASLWLKGTRRGVFGAMLIFGVLGATGLYGSIRSGDYAAFVTEYGSPADLVAKAVGFRISAITITGEKVLNPSEILHAAGIDPTRSLLWLNATAVREHLMAVPLVRDAVVTKLFPDRLTLALTERDPVAIWQKDGHLAIVSGDGVVIDDVSDDRFITLPFVVGEGANTKVAEFLALLDRAGDMRTRIVAGVRVSDRRWDLKMDNGLRVMLPEIGPGDAVARLAQLDAQYKLIDKDLVTLDLRRDGRITVRLSEDAAAARTAALAKKPKQNRTPE